MRDRTRDPVKKAGYEAELAVPPFPIALFYLWSTFWRLRRRKAPGPSGAAPIEWSDLDAFLRLSGERLAPWEIEVIETLDDLLIASPKPTTPETAPPNK